MKYKAKEIMSIMNMPDPFDYVKIKGFLNNVSCDSSHLLQGWTVKWPTLLESSMKEIYQKGYKGALN